MYSRLVLRSQVQSQRSESRVVGGIWRMNPRTSTKNDLLLNPHVPIYACAHKTVKPQVSQCHVYTWSTTIERKDNYLKHFSFHPSCFLQVKQKPTWHYVLFILVGTYRKNYWGEDDFRRAEGVTQFLPFVRGHPGFDKYYLSNKLKQLK